MSRADTTHGRRFGFRRGVLVVALALVASTLALAATPSAGVAAEEELERQMRVVEAADVGPEALVNTLGLRSAKKTLAGQYVTIDDGQRKLKARVANQIYTEFGVFRDANNRFKLLGVDGRWVKLKKTNAGKFITGTWGRAWDKGWSFKVIRPKASQMGVNVVSELIAAGINRRQPVCVKVFSPNGKYRGLLGVSNRGVSLLKAGATCGTSTATLFLTDTVPRGTRPGSVAKGVEIDKLSYVKYVAPDMPALTLSETRRELMRQDIEDYFTALRLFNDGVNSDVADNITKVAFLLLTESYEIPGEEAEEVNLLDFFIDQTTTLLAFVPKWGEIASAAIQVVYDSVSLGVAIAHNQNLEGPRVVEGVSNETLRTASAIMTEYKDTFSDIGTTIDEMKQVMLEGCSSRRECTSDRKLAAWWQADPNADLPLQTELARQQTVAAHEYVIWKRLLPIRGLLMQPPEWLSKHGGEPCNPGYPYNTGYHNEDVLNRYAIWAAEAPNEAQYGKPLVVTHLFRPYHDWIKKNIFCETHHRPYISAWTLGLADNDDGAATPVKDTARLFDAWDPDEPITSGFGLSKQEVACEWLDNEARGYMGRAAGRYFNPCHFAFYGVDGNVVDPYADEPNTFYRDALPWSAAYWLPDEAEIDAGRPVEDPDVVSPSVPQLAYRSCAAFDAGEVKSVPGGDAVKVHFTNLFDGAIDVFWVQPNGTLRKWGTVARQDQLARPLSGPRRNGQLVLEYSDAITTTVGTAFLVRSSGRCLGTWTVEEMPPNPAVPYAVAEVHGHDGILLAP